jgi:Protein of unknown function (DUF732)
MTRTAVRRSVSSVIAALLVAAAGAVSVAPAHADENDDRFIEYLDQKGVPYESETQIIRVAKDFCLARSRQNESQWRAGYYLAREQGWSETEVVNFAAGAIPTYCPNA